MTEQLVTIHPKTQRAKNRVREHGSVMRYIRSGPRGILVESLQDTFGRDVKGKWMGWWSSRDASWEPFTRE